MTEAHTDGRDVTRRTLLQRGAGAAAAGAALAFAGPPAAAHARPGPAAEPLPATVAGVRVPDSAVARHTVAFAREVSSPSLFNHVLRSYVFGALVLDRQGARYDRELAFVAAVLHDLGLVEAFQTPAERFEVDGADAARRFLRRLGVPAGRLDVVWDAIALHTSAGIAARKRPEIALVSVGSALDFTGNGLERIPSDALTEVLDAFPRLEFKKAALETILSLCRTKPMGELMHPFAEVGRRHLPGFAVPTVEDLLVNAPFAQ
ncbi:MULTISPECIES: HD domain-containing protein [Streptomyces]|uniref:HD domain-containing protein n=1 Tax=Streptomyces TaxID=1883 RepID=UPI001673ECB5|nr:MULTISPECIES: HD domain-containing protein [Streptomyces]MBK3523121.1 HD domain-containing protein [Streptomyces sp. MBT70]GGS08134.1 HD domain-containing protein [Streptomyces eurythermus]